MKLRVDGTNNSWKVTQLKQTVNETHFFINIKLIKTVDEPSSCQNEQFMKQIFDETDSWGSKQFQKWTADETNNLLN